MTATRTCCCSARRSERGELPLELKLRDFHATEVADLPRRLDTTGAPKGVDPDVGDITYYAPWGNLAVFYLDSGYADGLVKLGRVDAGVATFSRHTPPFTVRIERVERR